MWCERELDPFGGNWSQCQIVDDKSQRLGAAQWILVICQPHKQTSVRPFVCNVLWNTS